MNNKISSDRKNSYVVLCTIQSRKLSCHFMNFKEEDDDDNDVSDEEEKGRKRIRKITRTRNRIRKEKTGKQDNQILRYLSV